MPPQYPFAPGPFSTSQSQSQNPSNNARPNKYSPVSPSMSSASPRNNYSSPSTTSLLPHSATRDSPGVQAASFIRGPPTLRTLGSSSSLNESPYSSASANGRSAGSIADKFSLSADPSAWGTDINPNHPEPDDYLHNPDPRRDRKNDAGGNVLTCRGLSNLGCLIFLGTALITLFAGYPLITYFTKHPLSTLGGFNIGGINATGQVPKMPGNWGLIDLDTPHSAYTIPSFNNPGDTWQLVFSDEFNTDGRPFWPGDDPYWEAVDLHYWATGNLEWYDPAAVTTENGSLVITYSANPEHDLNYTGGLISSWNKFCFTGGMILTSVQLPGSNSVAGLWPAVWAMGNLGRAGYGATLDGMWPYSYDSCDVGTAPNQTFNGLPLAATVGGPSRVGGALSYLPGQRLSRCTCPNMNQSHPGPMHSDGTYVGRSSPEIDVFEAQIQYGVAGVSQSAQWAPFNANYEWFNTSQNLIIPNPQITALNRYIGGDTQQATSVVTQTNVAAYELDGGQYSTYGFEYKPGFDNAYISWISNDQIAWTLNVAGMAADTQVEIGPRPVSQEPMYLIVNLGMSPNFGRIDFNQLTFPAHMRVDWIRVYQPANAINIGCDPPDFPTAAYINQYIEAYTNPNLTTWTDDFKQPFPLNSFLQQCSPAQ